MQESEIKNSLDGFLLVDKPLRWTSHDVVAKVRQQLPKGTKVGHAGTLDPLATGLLILGIGRATKQLGALLGLDKKYEATIRLGETSATDDGEGPITGHEVKIIPVEADVKKALIKMIGETMQTPPIYSAQKLHGKPLHRLVRKGQTVEARPRPVTIKEIEIKSYQYPELKIAVHCSSGTYIRSIARDLGATLNTGGYLAGLRRISIGEFGVDQSLAIDQIIEKGVRHYLLSPAETLSRK